MTRFLVVTRYLVILVIVSFASFKVFEHKADQKKILVVHSYYKDMPWVNEIDEGIRRALDKNQNHSAEVQVRTHYMNLKNHPDCNYYANAAYEVQLNIKDWQPDAVVIMDDLAQALVGFNLIEILPKTRKRMAQDLVDWISQSGGCDSETKTTNSFYIQSQVSLLPENPIKIVFAGVNGTGNRYGYHLGKNVSGVFEHKNYNAILDAILTIKSSLQSEAVQIQQLNDSSATSFALNELYSQGSRLNSIDTVWRSKKMVRPKTINAKDFNQWRAVVDNAVEDNQVLLISNYQNLTQTLCDADVINFFSSTLTEEGCLSDLDKIPTQIGDGQAQCKTFNICPGALVQWTDHYSPHFPPIGTNTNFVRDGGLMTLVVSGIEQGERAMNMAFDAMFDPHFKHKIESAERFVVGMNQSLLRTRKVTVPDIYRSFSMETNHFVELSENQYFIPSAEKQ